MQFPAWRVFLFAISFCATSLPSGARGAENSASKPPIDADKSRQISRGKLVFLQHCVICHQSTGQGSPGVFPPLAQSDFLLKEKRRSILAVVQGLSEPITVNGQRYHGAMPPVVLDDQKVADVLTYARNSFGNSGDAITADEVRDARAKSRFPTYELLVKAAAYPPLPNAPADFTLREVVRLTDHGTRLAWDAVGRGLYVLGNQGEVWRVETATGKTTSILRGEDYIDRKLGDPSTVGFTFDHQRRLYIVVDQRTDKGPLVTNNVTVFRTTKTEKGEPAQPKPWLRTSYPWGIGPFNHGVGHIAIGPDGFVYVSSGSRTDGNEAGTDDHFFKGGEVPTTACLWRLDPSSAHPEIEIYARGLRNAYGFCWSDKGEMFATDNGPDADAPEELNLIERGKHYGFPFQFADWSNKPYPYTPDAPAGQAFARPIPNLGPAAGGNNAQPISSFDPHSSPAGIAFLGSEFPPDHRGTLLVTRFGNLLKRPVDAGYDVLQVRLQRDAAGNYRAGMTTFLAPLGRPLDIVVGPTGRIYVLEYTRQTDNKAEFGMLPGRILELAAKAVPGK